MYIFLHVKKHHFIHFCCVSSKLSKALSVSLISYLILIGCLIKCIYLCSFACNKYVLFRNYFHSLKKGKFQEIWKKANVVPAHKKEDKMLVKNYRPISLLPIFGKILERVIYNSLLNYFQSNRRFTSSQFGFLRGDLCIAQLLSIIHEIQTAFDENPMA